MSPLDLLAFPTKVTKERRGKKLPFVDVVCYVQVQLHKSRKRTPNNNNKATIIAGLNLFFCISYWFCNLLKPNINNTLLLWMYILSCP